MPQYKIEKAYFALWGREVTVHEFEEFRRTHSYFWSFRDLRCVHCDDPIEFVSRDGGYFFKHNPHGDGHEFCQLYSGHKDPTPEFQLKIKTAHDKDIGLLFNILNVDGRWKASLTIPPLERQEIARHQANGTTIKVTLDYGRELSSIPVNFEQFTPGELRRLDLPTIPKQLWIRFSGSNRSSSSIKLQLDGFVPERTLFQTTLRDSFQETVHNSGIIDLRPLRQFSLRRVSNLIYTERPYVFFVDNRRDNYHFPINPEHASSKKLLFNKDPQFPYDAYQVVFHSINQETSDFCAKRGCVLEERSDAVLLWPPVITSGENRFLDGNCHEMFFSLEGDRRVFDLISVATPRDFFKVSNKNIAPFYVVKRTEPDSGKPFGTMSNESQQEVDCSHIPHYRFIDGVLLGKETEHKHRLSAGETLLQLLSRLSPKLIVSGETMHASVSVVGALLKDAIDSPSDYVLFAKGQHSRLRSAYGSDQFVQDYLDYCLYQGEINENALRLLVGGMQHGL